jgi:hypothetical protein
VLFNTSTGAISWETDNRDVGHYTFIVTHFDGHNTQSSTTFGVTVENEVPKWTETAPSTIIVPANRSVSVDLGTNDEKQDDWRGDDNATYTLVSGPSGMTVDPVTGFLNWAAYPIPGGTTDVWVKFDDGNGGVIFFKFAIIVDDPVNDLPFYVRDPESPFTNLLDAEHRDTNNLGDFNPENGPDNLTHSGKILPANLAESTASPVRPGQLFEGLLETPRRGIDDLLQGLDHSDLKQPSLDKLGSIPPITPLGGYPHPVAKGHRLFFEAEEIKLAEDLVQPDLSIAGTQAPDTPLEGYIRAVEQGKILNLSYFPIREAKALKLDDLTVSDLLGL